MQQIVLIFEYMVRHDFINEVNLFVSLINLLPTLIYFDELIIYLLSCFMIKTMIIYEHDLQSLIACYYCFMNLLLRCPYTLNRFNLEIPHRQTLQPK